MIASLEFFNLHDARSLQWLWALVPLALLSALDLRRRQRVLRAFVSQSLLDDVSPRRSVARPILKFALLALGLASLVFALARPRWNPHQIEHEHDGQNLLFCLDVSNSMRAQDVDPSRLEAARSAIRLLVEALPAGNQVGLVAYAGRANVECPLTPNYQHLLSVLEDVSYNSVGAGGSNLGDAVYKATHDVLGLVGEGSAARGETVIEAEQPQADRNSDVLIILTDGESHEGHAREMVREAYHLGVAICIIGLGTEQGAPIPIEVDGKMTTLKYKDEEVITHFDDKSLREVVKDLPEERRAYLPAGASQVDLLDVYNRVISEQNRSKEKLRVTLWEEKFQLFVGIGLALVVLSSLVSDQQSAWKRGGLR